MVIAYVGAGGKTSLLKRHAQMYREQGLRVFICTSTHMFIEEDTIVGDDAQVILQRLCEDGRVMAGTPCGEKIGPLSEETYRQVCAGADVVLVEADGSRHMPLKYPAEGEPVIYENVDEIIVVCGMHALDRPAREVCHRLELAKKCLGVGDETIINAEHIRRLVLDGYVLPLRRQYQGARIRVHAVHDNSPRQLAAAQYIQNAFPD